MPSNEVFFFSQERSARGHDIASIFRKRKVKGEVGLEIECEGNKFNKDETVATYWKYEHDGSLRGYDNAEYVLKHPISFEEVPKAVDALWDDFKKVGTKLDDSNRTSVHVHLNVGSWHLPRLCSFMALYFSIEEILAEWCGESRVGNLFCLRAKDAPAIISKMKPFLKQEGPVDLPNTLHYAGLNPKSLQKFGSLEVRLLRGVTEPKILIDWVTILERLYKLSGSYEDPREVVEGFSGVGAMGYLESVLGPTMNTVLGGIPLSPSQINESLYDGIRLAQDLVYCRDWSEYEEADMKKDPFGRASNSDLGAIMSFIQSPPPVGWFSDTDMTLNSTLSPGVFEPFYSGPDEDGDVELENEDDDD